MSTVASNEPPVPAPDPWAAWLLKDRHGDDPVHGREIHSQVLQFADRVLAALSLAPGQTLLDVGTGDGLVALRAIEQVGAGLQVILTDLSGTLLGHAQAEALRRGVASQCRFLQGSAERLEGVPDASVDAVTTRSVLAYVQDRPAALAEFARVLRPGGSMSIAEPMLRDDALAVIALRRIVDAGGTGERDVVTRLLHKWKSAQFPDTSDAMARNPLVNYSERDLLTQVRDAGFGDIHLELHIDVRPRDGIPWSTFLASSPHPWSPTLATILAERFDGAERAKFERLLRPAVEAGVGDSVERMVYLNAIKCVDGQRGAWQAVDATQRPSHRCHHAQ